jgi:arsenate reductase-like glutaredoxin family protein
LATVEEIKHFDDNSAAYDFIDVQSMPITEETLKGLDE